MDLTQLQLPVDGPADPYLNHINIFLTLAPTAAKQGAKLGEKRISAEASSHLAWYNYNDFLNEVINLAETTCARYPELQAISSSKDRHLDGEPGPSNESLRGLAVAANALQSEVAGPHDRASPEAISHHADITPNPAQDATTARGSATRSNNEPSPSPSVTPSQAAEPDSRADYKPSGLLTQCTMKTIGPDGWKVIGNAEDWYHVLTERAFAVWADGVCNIIVELQGSVKLRSGGTVV